MNNIFVPIFDLTKPYEFCRENAPRAREICETLRREKRFKSCPFFESVYKTEISDDDKPSERSRDRQEIPPLEFDSSLTERKLEDRVESSQLVDSLHQKEICEDIPEDDNDKIKSEALLLKTILQNLTETLTVDDLPLERLNVISDLNLSRVEYFVGLLEMSTICDSSLFILFEKLSELDTRLSYASCCVFVNIAVLPRVLHLEQNASRNLMKVLVTLVQKFPRATIYSVFIPCCSADSFGQVQLNLFVDLAKSWFLEEYLSIFCREVAKLDRGWNENFVALLNSLLFQKVSLEQDTTEMLIQKFKLVHDSMNKSLKFTKLLQLFIEKFHRQFTVVQVESMDNILDRNETFLKKRCKLLLSTSK